MRTHFKILAIYLFIGLLLYVFIRLYLEERTLWLTIKNINVIHLIPQCILAICFGLVNSYLYNQILRTFNVHLRFREWFGLGCVNTFANYIFPFKTGTLIKAMYLKHKYNFKVSHNSSILIFVTFSFFEIIFLLSVLLFFYIKVTNVIYIPHINYLIGFSSFIFVAGLFFMVYLQKLTITKTCAHPFLKRILNMLSLSIEGMKLISRNKRLLSIILISHVLIFTIQILRLYFAYLAIGTPPALFKITFVNLLYCISSLIFLTPGNLGFQEIVISISSGLIGLTNEEGFIASAIIRVVAITLTFLLGTFFYFFLNIHRVLLNTQEQK